METVTKLAGGALVLHPRASLLEAALYQEVSLGACFFAPRLRGENIFSSLTETLANLLCDGWCPELKAITRLRAKGPV